MEAINRGAARHPDTGQLAHWESHRNTRLLQSGRVIGKHPTVARPHRSSCEAQEKTPNLHKGQDGSLIWGSLPLWVFFVGGCLCRVFLGGFFLFFFFFFFFFFWGGVGKGMVKSICHGMPGRISGLPSLNDHGPTKFSAPVVMARSAAGLHYLVLPPETPLFWPRDRWYSHLDDYPVTRLDISYEV